MAERHRSLTGPACALAAAVLLAGCAVPAVHEPPQYPRQYPPQSPPPANPPPSPVPPRPQPPTREARLSAASHSLVTQAHAQIAHGDLPAASSTLDRALRIEPNNPLLWIELGRLRLAERDARQAEGCARKALALASGDRNAQARSGRLLADALRAQQRNQEAREIESQPFMN